MVQILRDVIEPFISNSNCSIGRAREADTIHRINLKYFLDALNWTILRKYLLAISAKNDPPPRVKFMTGKTYENQKVVGCICNIWSYASGNISHHIISEDDRLMLETIKK